LTSVERRLATSAVVKKLNNATQFWGSAIVNLPTGGKKKKLKVRVAAIEARDASKNPQIVAMTNTSSRYAKPTVVAFTGTRIKPTQVTSATPAKDDNSRSAREVNAIDRLRLLF
jgi:hypothetical protein